MATNTDDDPGHSALQSKMFPKNSRRPLTLDHKIRLKKQLAKAYKTSGISVSDASSANEHKKVHQTFKPRPEDKIIKKRQLEQNEREILREVTKNILLPLCLNFIYFYYRKRKRKSKNVRKSETRASLVAGNRTRSSAPRTGADNQI